MRSILHVIAVLAVLLLAPLASAEATGRERTSLDADWRFALGNAADPAKDFGFGTGHPWAKAGEAVGAVQPSYDDSAWRTIRLPHDWVVELPFVHDDDGDHTTHGSKPVGRRFPDTTIGWYRKRFDIPKSDEGRRVWIEFDGVFRDCLVWLNGHLLARNESGYIGFTVDATDYINYGAQNVLVVRCDASQFEGWFYEGAGIYRHVWLTKVNPVHVQPHGVQVISTLAPDMQSARFITQAEMYNDSEKSRVIAMRVRLRDAAGKQVSEYRTDTINVSARQITAPLLPFTLDHPDLWSPDHPALYTLTVDLIALDGSLIDSVSDRIGVRSIAFDKDRGFILNGKPVKLKGVCCHQDHAGVGSALPDAVQYFRIAKLKEMGCNAYRTSHNPPTPELLDACDELGMLVLDEHRLVGSSPEILDQLERFIRRDRDRACVVAWSIGNEEPEQYTDRGRRIAEAMVRTVKHLDPTRKTTFASNAGGLDHGINPVVDIRGFNYFMDTIAGYHAKHPDQPLMCTETASAYYTRGEYAKSPERGYVSAYDTNKPDYGATAAEWLGVCMTRDYLAGGFAWTGFDYRGEPSPYSWPCISSHFGIIDTCGFPKDVFYYYQSWWQDPSPTTAPVVHLLPHWNWSPGKPIDVWCFSNCDRVRLTLNGKDLGEQTIERLGHAEWKVPFEPGALEAIGIKDGKTVGRDRIETTGPAAKLVARIEPTHAPAGRQDAVLVTLAATDAQGRLVPTASIDVQLSLEGGGGGGQLLGVGNGDPSCHDPDTFVGGMVSKEVGGWRMASIKEKPAAAPSVADLTKLDSKEVKVDRDARSMRSPGYAAFWTTLRADADDSKSPTLSLSLGQTDDHGWVYLNGALIAESHDWDTPLHADIAGKVHEGDNELVVIVKNDQGPGGLGRGVSLARPTPAPAWHRKLFNGLAQVIIRPDASGRTCILRATADGVESASIEIPASENAQGPRP